MPNSPGIEERPECSYQGDEEEEDEAVEGEEGGEEEYVCLPRNEKTEEEEEEEERVLCEGSLHVEKQTCNSREKLLFTAGIRCLVLFILVQLLLLKHDSVFILY